MAPAIRGVSPVPGNGTASPAWATPPYETEPGDLLLVHVANDTTNVTLSTPAGWILVDGPNTFSTGHTSYLFARIADGTTADQFSSVLSGGASWVSMMVAISDAERDSVTAAIAAHVMGGTASATAHQGSINTTAPGQLVLAFFSADATNASRYWTSTQAGGAFVYRAAEENQHQSLGAFAFPAPVPPGNFSITETISSAELGSEHLVVINPGPGAPDYALVLETPIRAIENEAESGDLILEDSSGVLLEEQNWGAFVLEDGSGNLQLEDGTGDVLQESAVDVPFERLLLEDGTGVLIVEFSPPWFQYYQLEDATGNIQLEDGSGSLLSEGLLFYAIDLETGTDRLLLESGEVLISEEPESGAQAGGTSWRDAATRFKLAAQAWRDTATRFYLTVQGFRDAGTRFKLFATGYRDAQVRFKLSAQAYRDAQVRFKLVVQGYRDAATRFRLNATGYRDAQVRFKLTVQAWRDAQVRFKLTATGFRDAKVRFVLVAQAWRDAKVRFVLTARSWRDAQVRFVLNARAWRDATTRFKLVATGYRDAATRFYLSVPGTYRDAVVRFRLNATGFRDAKTRFYLTVRAWRDSASRFVLTVQGFRDAKSRFYVAAQAWRDGKARFSLRATAWRDAQTRFKLALQGYRDTATRFSVRVTGYRDSATRFLLTVSGAVVGYRDGKARFRVLMPQNVNLFIGPPSSGWDLGDPEPHFGIGPAESGWDPIAEPEWFIGTPETGWKIGKPEANGRLVVGTERARQRVCQGQRYGHRQWHTARPHRRRGVPSIHPARQRAHARGLGDWGLGGHTEQGRHRAQLQRPRPGGSQGAALRPWAVRGMGQDHGLPGGSSAPGGSVESNGPEDLHEGRQSPVQGGVG